MTDIYDGYKAFLDKRLIDEITEYENLFARVFLPAIKDIRTNGVARNWFHTTFT